VLSLPGPSARGPTVTVNPQSNGLRRPPPHTHTWSVPVPRCGVTVADRTANSVLRRTMPVSAALADAPRPTNLGRSTVHTVLPRSTVRQLVMNLPTARATRLLGRTRRNVIRSVRRVARRGRNRRTRSMPDTSKTAAPRRRSQVPVMVTVGRALQSRSCTSTRTFGLRTAGALSKRGGSSRTVGRSSGALPPWAPTGSAENSAASNTTHAAALRDPTM
jgi:hypothetical protein